MPHKPFPGLGPVTRCQGKPSSLGSTCITACRGIHAAARTMVRRSSSSRSYCVRPPSPPQRHLVQGHQLRALRGTLSCSKRRQARRHSAAGLAEAGGGAEGGDAAAGAAGAGGAGTEPGPSPSETEGCCRHLPVSVELPSDEVHAIVFLPASQTCAMDGTPGAQPH